MTYMFKIVNRKDRKDLRKVHKKNFNDLQCLIWFKKVNYKV